MSAETSLYETPVDTFIARFFGDSLLLPVEVVAEGSTMARVRALGREVTVRRAGPLTNGAARLVVRPGQVHLDPTGDGLAVAAEVLDVVYLGDATQLRCHAAGVGPIQTRVNPRHANVQTGQRVQLGFLPEEAICVPEH
jgi:ABC-type Fe3+/spermidine/putrescine transport system ATPase subunit